MGWVVSLLKSVGLGMAIVYGLCADLNAEAAFVQGDDVVVVTSQGNVWVRNRDTFDQLGGPTSNSGFDPLRTVSVDENQNVLLAGDFGTAWIRNANDLTTDVVSGSGFGPIVSSAFLPNGNIALTTATTLFLRDSSLGSVHTFGGFGSGLENVAAQSNNGMVVNWDFGTGQNRVYYQPPTPEVAAAGFGSVSALTIQSNDNIVIGSSDGSVFFRGNLPTIGIDTVSLAEAVTALVRLSNDVVIVGTASGVIHALYADGSGIIDSDAGYGTITALAVQSDDDIIVANAEGVIRRLQFVPGEDAWPVLGFGEGYGPITALAVIPVPIPEPTAFGLLTIGMVGALSVARRRGAGKRNSCRLQ
jgi:hypothetical protein